ncbi:unnamed protein product [Gordionus sp. m RMFG-2023]
MKDKALLSEEEYEIGRPLKDRSSSLMVDNNIIKVDETQEDQSPINKQTSYVKKTKKTTTEKKNADKRILDLEKYDDDSYAT